MSRRKIHITNTKTLEIKHNTDTVLDEEVEVIQEISDSDIEWTTELVDVYTESGVDFYFDDLVEDLTVFCAYMFKRMKFDKPTNVQDHIINFFIKETELDKMIQGMRGVG